MASNQSSAEEVLKIARGFQQACVLMAAAELDLFALLAKQSTTSEKLAHKLNADPRATRILLDALTAMKLLSKQDSRYVVCPELVDALTTGSEHSVLAMVRHLANCLRSWAQLAQVVKHGQITQHTPSIRGPQGDLESFIEAMNDISRTMADPLIQAISPLHFKHLLDLGGGPGTWTIAFLKASPQAKATLFDLPDVIPIARDHIKAAGLTHRVDLVPGDFKLDQTLPSGTDLVWIGAIVHMNSPAENRALFKKVHTALTEGGRILIRDVVMEDSHTEPADGAMFAINMLVNTAGGGTFTFTELKNDLQAAGFSDVILLHRGEFMNSVVQASKQ